LNKFKKIFRLILIVICVAYLMRFFYKSRDSLQIAFTVNFKIIFYIILLQLIYYLLVGYRFQLVLEKCSGCKLNFLPWLKIFILGKFLNTVFSQVGSIYRSVRLKQDYSVSYTRYISSFTSMAWMDTCMNLVIAAAVIVVLNPGFRIGQFVAWKILTILTIVVIALPVLAEILLRKINFKNRYLNWLHSKLSEVLTVSVNNLRDMAYLLKIGLLGLAVFIRTCVMFYVYFSAFDVHVSLPALAVFYTLFKLSTFIVLTPGNLGVQEVAYGFLSEQMGIGMAQGVLVATFIRVVGTCSISALGVTLGGMDLLRHRRDYAEFQE